MPDLYYVFLLALIFISEWRLGIPSFPDIIRISSHQHTDELTWRANAFPSSITLPANSTWLTPCVNNHGISQLNITQIMVLRLTAKARLPNSLTCD